MFFRGFPLCLQSNAGTVYRYRQEYFLPNNLQFTSHSTIPRYVIFILKRRQTAQEEEESGFWCRLKVQFQMHQVRVLGSFRVSVTRTASK
jgi:hypothetical protein